MSTTPTFQNSTTSAFRHNNPFDAKARKVSANVDTFDQITSLTTIDGTHTHIPESKSFHNVEYLHAYPAKSSHSIYNESEYNHSHILPEESHQFQSPKLSEVPYLNDYSKSAASSSGFNYFLRSDENRNLRLSAPDNSYYRESAGLNYSPAKTLSSTLPSHTNSNKTLSSVIGDLVERDREERRLRELRSTEDMVRNHETITEMIKNERNWKKGLEEVDALLKVCKENSEASTRKRLSSTSALRHSEPLTYQYRPQAIQEKAYRNSESSHMLVKPNIYKEECEDFMFNFALRKSRENSLKNLKNNNSSRKLSDAIAEEVEEDKELRHRKDMFYMEEAIRNGTTITDMIKNEKRRSLELKMSQGNMEYVRDCASKLLL